MPQDREPHRIEITTSSRRDHRALLRLFLVICIFILAAGLFSAHFDSVYDRLRTERSISDAAGLFTAEDLKLAKDFDNVMRARLGLELHLATFPGEATAPKLDGKAIFIGIGRRGPAVVILAPLAARALGPEVTNYLEHEHFAPYLADGRESEGLRRALKILWDGLIGPEERNEP